MPWTNEGRNLGGVRDILTLIDDFMKQMFIFTVRKKSDIKEKKDSSNLRTR
jgi:hypothetical protein